MASASHSAAICNSGSSTDGNEDLTKLADTDKRTYILLRIRAKTQYYKCFPTYSTLIPLIKRKFYDFIIPIHSGKYNLSKTIIIIWKHKIIKKSQQLI